MLNASIVRTGPRKGKPTLFYRVTYHYKNGSKTDDIALEHDDIKTARWYAASKCEEFTDPPIKIDVKRITKAEAIEIVACGGVDWINQSV